MENRWGTNKNGNAANALAEPCPKQGKKPIDAEIVSPVVIASFGGGLTIGNKSCPACNPQHTAVIKSFEFGFSNGAECDIEILDEQGGMLQESLGKLCKDFSGMTKDWQFWVRFGWSVVYCGGGEKLDLTPRIYFVAKNLQATFEGGKVKFKIKGADCTGSSSASRDSKVWGTDKQKMPLEKGLEKMWSSHDPVTQVQYKAKDSRCADDGGIKTTTTEAGFTITEQNKQGFNKFEWKDDPKSAWQADNQNRLAATMKWTENFVTKNDRGTYVINDHTSPTPVIVIVEANDPPPCKEANEQIPPCKLPYIVNGGKESNVISFSPTISFPMSWESSKTAWGFTGTPMSARIKRKDPCEKENDQEWVGMQATQSVPRSGIHVWGTKAPEHLEVNNRTNQDVNAKISGINPVEAELKIQGSTDPLYWEPMYATQRQVHIVVINPFHIRGAGNGECGDWLAKPICNSALTSKNWRVKSCSHSIREGSFTTSLKVLLTPGGGDKEGEARMWSDGKALK